MNTRIYPITALVNIPTHEEETENIVEEMKITDLIEDALKDYDFVIGCRHDVPAVSEIVEEEDRSKLIQSIHTLENLKTSLNQTVGADTELQEALHYVLRIARAAVFEQGGEKQ